MKMTHNGPIVAGHPPLSSVPRDTKSTNSIKMGKTVEADTLHFICPRGEIGRLRGITGTDTPTTDIDLGRFTRPPAPIGNGARIIRFRRGVILKPEKDSAIDCERVYLGFGV
jgi:hypothetical protein